MNNIISERKYVKEDIDYNGNRFLIGNGKMGIRGTLDEYTSDKRPAINLAGVYDCVPGKWRESVNAPNVLFAYTEFNGRKYSLPDTEAVEHFQFVDISNAVHGRKTIWETESGLLTIISHRFVSMSDKDIIKNIYSVSSDSDGEITVKIGIDSNIWDINGPHFEKKVLTKENDSIGLLCTTIEKALVVSASVKVAPDFDIIPKIEIDGDIYCYSFNFYARKGVTYSFDRTAMILVSNEPSFKCRIPDISYETEFIKHSEIWKAIWDMSLVTIDGDDNAMLALNYSIYHLNCIAPRHSNSMSIPARGLSGQVYKGAVFWDTEMFMFDYFLLTDPNVAKTLIKYRIDTLPGAMKKAREYGFEGAFYAWESHEGGFDACTDYNITDVFTGRPTRTYFRDKQVHVSSAMVYALSRYIEVTGDKKIIDEGGGKMLLECARFYYSILLKRAGKDIYEIHDVVGPDEYHERVNNNAYTNRLAKFTILKAVDLIREYGICNEEELKNMVDAANKIKIQEPDQKTGLIEQFDGYFKLENVSVDTVRSRLIDPREYWGGANGVASQTQINKQADVIAMLGMFPDDYSSEILKNNWLYYEPRTEHGSSLSACMFALVACYIGRPDYAYPLFLKSAYQDLDKSTKLWLGLIFIGGTHPAAAGGAWMVATRGFAGLKIKDSKPVAGIPALPIGWKRISFKIICGGNKYNIEATAEKTVITKEH